MWKNLKVGTKITLNIAISFILLVLLAVLSIKNISTIDASARLTRDESARFAILAKEIEIHVIQTQQWLTDISVTRAAPGLDNGFGEAAKHREELHGILNEFEKLFQQKNDPAMLAFISKLRSSYDEYYDMGTLMANKYIKEGTGAGNLYMATFDPFAEKLAEQVQELVSVQLDGLRGNMTNITEKTRHLLFIFTTAAVLILFFNIVSGMTLARSITRPLARLVSVSHEISAGNLTKKTDIDSADEIGRLAESIDSMASSMKKMVIDIHEKNLKLAETSEQLSETSQRMASSSDEMTSQSFGVAAAAKQIHSNMNIIAMTVEELTAVTSESAVSADQMSANMQSMASAVEEMSSSVGSVAQHTDKAAELARQAYSFSGTANDNMLQLNKSAEDIGKIVSVITKIAEQTKLLALNATIEASRAGNMGNGFAVVANEVKGLARQTYDATLDIARQIKEIQEQTGTVVENIGDMAQVNQQINDLAAMISAAVLEQSQAACDISRTVTETSLGATSIFDTIQRLANKLEKEILGNVRQATDVTNEVSRNIHEVSTVSKDVALGANTVSAVAHELKVQAAHLLQQVNRFHIRDVVAAQEGVPGV